MKIKQYYCVFALNSKGKGRVIKGEKWYHALFPFAVDKNDATVKARRLLAKKGILVEGTKCVGPVDLTELHEVTLEHYLGEDNRFDGYVYLEEMQFCPNPEMVNFSNKQILRLLASDWIVNSDMC